MDFIKDTTEYIFISSEPQPSDVIFLPGSSDPSLPERAAELYLQGCAPLLLPSGRYGKLIGHFKTPKRGREIYSGDYETEAEFYRDVLIKNGVPDSAILCEDQAEYTYQNAQFTKELLRKRGITVRRAILVCKSYHARRAYTYYKNAFVDVDISVSAVEGTEIRSDNWFETEAGRSLVAGELRRLSDQIEYLAVEKEKETV